MRVLHFYKSYLPDSLGGVERFINQLAISSSSLNVDSEILALSSKKGKQIIKIDNHTVYCFSSNFEIASTPFSLSAFICFKRLIQKADIIHYHFPYPFADLAHFIARVKKPSIVTYHSDIIKQKNLYKIYYPLMIKFLRSVHHIVATSPNYLDSSDILKRFKDKVSIIPIGIDKTSYPKINKSKLEFWQEKFGKNFFLFIGVMRYYKGLHTAIEAAKKCNYPIILVGDGPLNSILKAKVKKLKINNIKFVNSVSEEDKVALIKLSYAILFPSHKRSEAFGITLLEGAMFGKPLISSEIQTGTSFININKKTGLVVSPENSNELFQAMEYLWKNPIEAKKMGRCAEDRYRKLFTANRMAKSYYNLYNSLLK